MQILPMDILRRTVYAFGAVRVETFESGTVMVVYLLIALGAGVSLLASLASSRLFTRIGGGVSLAGHAVLPVAVACNSAAGELSEHLSDYGCRLAGAGTCPCWARH
ncbi:MAG: hypothetical protein MZV63_07150 [Marinilabiliales bacterium]|nr:hypothetical protein [Marinilabiliales bacterium]